ncbi:MAG TPA: SH3 domain-containing protein [Pyrinomonadaceae bacterium]|nr:SH3 domain-containing protein [Pyrinomonadaceae bacterium]
MSAALSSFSTCRSHLSNSKTVSTIALSILICLLCSVETASAKRRRAVLPGRTAVVIDERLAALRDAPSLSATLLQRMSRGRAVAITGMKRSDDGVTFYRVSVTRRTGGWVQAEALAAPGRVGEGERILRLILASDDFERIARARIFLDMFPRSPLQPQVLLLLGEAAEAAAARLSHEAQRRLDEQEIEAGGAPAFTYFMNYSGLDRYRRQGVSFTFDRATKQFHYDGMSWREILRNYPRSHEAVRARELLNGLRAQM